MQAPPGGEDGTARAAVAGAVTAALAALLAGAPAQAQAPSAAPPSPPTASPPALPRPVSPSAADAAPAPAAPAAPTPAAGTPAARRAAAAADRAKAQAEDEGEAEVEVRAGPRIQPGAVIGDIKPELQLSPVDIQSYGVSTLTELLDELAPQTRSDRGRGGESPVVLLNGRRISSFAEIRDIPTEAILRVDILPEEVALKYGYTANQRVVNVVLRRYFRALTVEGTGGGDTEGGQVSGQGEVDLLRIQRETRVTST